MYKQSSTVGKWVAATTLAISALTLSSAASAATFGVRVVDPQGEPVAGASVCIGLAGNYTQFGSDFTGTDGVVQVDVPNVPLIVTVSKTRFAGIRIEEPARGFNLIKEITLVDGVPGPRCRAGSTMVEGPGIDKIQIQNIDIDRGSSLVLKPTVTGSPSQYRIGSDEEFEGAQWKPYSDSIRIANSMADAGPLFLQMRQYAGSSKGSVEARSEIVTITVTN